MKTKFAYLLLCTILITNAHAGMFGFAPDSPLYVIDQAVDSIHYNIFTFTSEQKSYVKLEQAQERLDEMKQISSERPELMPNLILNYKENIADSASEINKTDDTAKAKYYEEAETRFENQSKILESMQSDKNFGEVVRAVVQDLNVHKENLRLVNSINENKISDAQSILDSRWNAMKKYCGIKYDYIRSDVNEVVRFQVLNNEGTVIWQKEIKVANQEITCDVSDEPTITASANIDYVNQAIQDDFRVSRESMINAFETGKIKVNPSDKVLKYI